MKDLRIRLVLTLGVLLAHICAVKISASDVTSGSVLGR